MVIGGFIPFTLTDYPGEIAAIIFTQGCNFSCPFCHNSKLIPFNPETAAPGQNMDGMEQVLDFLHSRRHRLSALVISGGEPTLQADLPDVLEETRRMGYKLKLDTNGSRPAVLRNILEQDLADMVAMDIKAPWAKYHLLAGRAVNTADIRESMELILESGIRYMFRTTFVPGLLEQGDLDMIRKILPPDAEYVVQEYRHTAAGPAL